MDEYQPSEVDPGYVGPFHSSTEDLHERNRNSSSSTREEEEKGERASHPPGSKAALVLKACARGDLAMLIAHATSPNGFVNDSVRQKAWPMLLGCSGEEKLVMSDWRELPPHRDEDQVRLDVNRSFIYYPSNQTEKQLDRRKADLSDLITEVLRRHRMLCYFQGYHDIVQVLLLVLGRELAGPAVVHLSLLKIRDFMLPSLSPALVHLRLLPSILNCVNADLCRHLSQTQPFFALAATLTLYAHDIQEYGDIARLFDFLIAQEAVVSIYLFAVIILSRAEELFEIPADEPEMLHSVLSKLPKPLDLEALISQTIRLYEQHPPRVLPGRVWRRVSFNSVLKTTQKPAANQTLEDGERYFCMQALELRRTELLEQAMVTLYKYRKPAGTVGLAILVGLLSFWLRRDVVERSSIPILRKLVGALKSVLGY